MFFDFARGCGGLYSLWWEQRMQASSYLKMGSWKEGRLFCQHPCVWQIERKTTARLNLVQMWIVEYDSFSLIRPKTFNRFLQMNKVALSLQNFIFFQYIPHSEKLFYALTKLVIERQAGRATFLWFGPFWESHLATQDEINETCIVKKEKKKRWFLWHPFRWLESAKSRTWHPSIRVNSPDIMGKHGFGPSPRWYPHFITTNRHEPPKIAPSPQKNQVLFCALCHWIHLRRAMITIKMKFMVWIPRYRILQLDFWSLPPTNTMLGLDALAESPHSVPFRKTTTQRYTRETRRTSIIFTFWKYQPLSSLDASFHSVYEVIIVVSLCMILSVRDQYLPRRIVEIRVADTAFVSFADSKHSTAHSDGHNISQRETARGGVNSTEKLHAVFL